MHAFIHSFILLVQLVCSIFRVPKIEREAAYALNVQSKEGKNCGSSMEMELVIG